MPSEPVRALLGEASDTSQAGEHERCLEVSERVEDELRRRARPDPMLLGWAWFYQVKSLFFLKRYAAAWERLTADAERAVSTKNMAYLSSLASEMAMHLGRAEDVVRWGERCMELRRADHDPVGVAQSAQTVCVLLAEMGRSELSIDAARTLLRVGTEAGAERAIVAGTRFLLDAANGGADSELKREVVRLLPRLRRIHDDRFSADAIEVASRIWTADWFFDCLPEDERTARRNERALFTAAGDGDLIELSRLLDAGVDVNARDAFDRTALLHAAFTGKWRAVERLLQRGADVEAENMQRRSALIVAADQGHARVVELLLGHGANPDHRGICDQTALIVASWQGHVACVGLLLAAGADPELLDVAGNTALTLTATEEQPEVVRALLAGGAELEHATPAGHTALMKSAMYGRERVVRALLGAGADRSRVDPQGMTAARWAAQEGFSDLARLLGPGADTKVGNPS